MNKTARTTVAAVGLGWSAVIRVAAQSPGVSSFISVAGKDTVAIEQYTRSGNTITGVWVSRQGGVFVHNYTLTLGPDGIPLHYDMILPPQRDEPPAASLHVTLDYGADSVRYVNTRNAETTSGSVAMKPSFPVLGRSLVGLELATMRLRSASIDSANILIHAPTGIASPQQSLAVRFSRGDSVRVGPLRGIVDPDGRLVRVTTGAVETRRVPTFDMAAMIAGFVVAEAPRRAAAAAALATRIEIPLAPSALARFAGDYALATGVTITVFLDGDKLMARTSDQSPVQLVPLAPTKFYFKVPGDQRAEFEVDASGAPTALVLSSGTVSQRAERKR